jgi:hypothetical protein
VPVCLPVTQCLQLHGCNAARNIGQLPVVLHFATSCHVTWTHVACSCRPALPCPCCSSLLCAQLLLQVLVSGADPQAALDAPRFCIDRLDSSVGPASVQDSYLLLVRGVFGGGGSRNITAAAAIEAAVNAACPCNTSTVSCTHSSLLLARGPFGGGLGGASSSSRGTSSRGTSSSGTSSRSSRNILTTNSSRHSCVSHQPNCSVTPRDEHAMRLQSRAWSYIALQAVDMSVQLQAVCARRNVQS